MTGELPSNQPEVRTVLVVDNEVLIRMVISQYLRDCGYKVIEAAGADEALLVLQHAELGVDVVLSAVQIPGSVDGFKLATWVRQNKPHVHVVLANGLTRAAEAAGELCESGPLLAKPYEPQAVAELIRRLLAKK